MAPTPAPDGTIGDRIRWLVDEYLGISQSEFARRLKVKQPQMARWINDASRPPNEGNIQAIAEEAGISPAWLRYGVGAPDDLGAEPAAEGGAEDALWRLELEAANRRASALDHLARAELAHAEASKLRAEALNSQSRAAQHDSERAREARSPERLLYEVKDLTGQEAARIIAALLDRAREQGIAQGGAATPEERAG